MKKNMGNSLRLVILSTIFCVSHTAWADNSPISIGEVSKNINNKTSKNWKTLDEKKLHELFSKKYMLNSSQAISSIGRLQRSLVTPVSGGTQLVAQAPGVSIISNNSQGGAGNYNISINGLGVGWWSGINNRNQITVLFDGIPMNNQITQNAAWQTQELPIAGLLQGSNVIYGPGNPDSRWYDSLGGTINFIPLCPSKRVSQSITLGAGSANSKTAFFHIDTGNINNWMTVIGAGYTTTGTSNNPDQSYDFPQHAWAAYIKTSKIFKRGIVSFGMYAENATEDEATSHSFAVPVTPLPGYSINGYGKPGTPYSQQTSGFYYTVPPYLNSRQDTEDSYLVYNKFSYNLTRNFNLKNNVWFRYGHREHYAVFNYYGIHKSPQRFEYYRTQSYTFGDKLKGTYKFYHNKISGGGWFQYTNYHNPISFFNPLLGTSTTTPNYANPVYFNSLFTSLFLQDKINLYKHMLSITPGVAYAIFNTDLTNLGTPPGVLNDTSLSAAETTFSRLEPSLGILFKPLNNISLYGHYAVTYQNPADNAYSAYAPIIKVQPNSSELVKNTDYQAGIRYAGKNLFLTAGYYHDYIQNLVTSVQPTGLNTIDGAVAIDLANEVYNGVNLSFLDKPFKHFTVNLTANIQHSYYSRGINSSGVSFDGENLPGLPNKSLTLDLIYRIYAFNGLITPEISDQFVGSQTIPNIATGLSTNSRTPSYNILNLYLDYKTTALNHLIPGLALANFKISGFNVLNRKYNVSEFESLGYEQKNYTLFAFPGTPAEVFGTVTFDF